VEVRELNSEGLMRGWAAGDKGEDQVKGMRDNQVRMTGSGM